MLSVPEHRNVTAAIIGNLLEWYEFTVYGFLAAILGRLFFPADDSFSSLLAAFGIFAIGFAVRRLGAVLFGHIGDRLGRKPTLILSVTMMGAGTFGIGILPMSSQIGGAAALISLLAIYRLPETAGKPLS